MDTNSQLRYGELRASLIALTGECPVDRCNPGDCPLFVLRRMNAGERLEWINALGEDDLNYLAAYHHVCLHLKLQSDHVDDAGLV